VSFKTNLLIFKRSEILNTQDEQQEKVSIIIITKNEEKNIISCLNSVYLSINKLELNYEVLVVDSNSTDRTVERVVSNKSKYKNIGVINILSSNQYSAALGRGIGLDNTNGDYLLFIDGDMELDKDFLTIALESLKNENTQCSGIIGIRNDIITFPDGSQNVNGNVYKVLNERPAIHFGGALLIKRKHLVQVGGYNKNIIASEEPELFLRLKKEGYWIKEIPIKMICHKIISTPRKIVNKRSKGIGQTFKAAIKKKTIMQIIQHKPLNKFLLPYILDLLFFVFLVCSLLYTNLYILFFAIGIQLLSLTNAIITKGFKKYIYVKFNFIYISIGLSHNNIVSYEYEKLLLDI